MRLINADKLYPDCMTKDGKLAISQSQIANAPSVEKPIRGIAKVGKNGEIEIELINPQGDCIRLDLAKKVIAKFAGYLDEDMIERMQIALEKAAQDVKK